MQLENSLVGSQALLSPLPGLLDFNPYHLLPAETDRLQPLDQLHWQRVDLEGQISTSIEGGYHASFRQMESELTSLQLKQRVFDLQTAGRGEVVVESLPTDRIARFLRFLSYRIQASDSRGF